LLRRLSSRLYKEKAVTRLSVLLDEALLALRSLDLVEKTYMTALEPNENGEIDYLLEVVSRDVESIDYSPGD